MDTTTLKPKSNRIEIIDAFRGFALAGIVLVHFTEQFLAAPAPEGAMDTVVQGAFDQSVDIFINFFLRGKFFALFSLLFGLGFFMQMDRAAQRGVDFRLRFLWRLLILLAIGYLHHMFYRGDILTIYAVLGLILVFFYRISDRWLIALIALIFLGVPRYVIFLIYGAGNLFGSVEFLPESPQLLAYFTTLTSGSLWSVFKSNATEGMLMKADFQLGVFSRGYLTFAFFLTGLLLGRMRFFENASHYTKQLKTVLKWAAGGLAGVIAVSVILLLTADVSGVTGLDSWLTMIGLTLYDLFNLSLTVIVLSLFTLFFQKVQGHCFFNHFAPYGRTALTNYFLQSVMGTALFYGWGLGLLGEIRNIHTFSIAAGIIILQVLASKWWLSKFRYGPLEWIWRVFTYGKRFPIRKR